MEIKDAVLDVELNKVKDFLAGFGLSFEANTELTLYAEEEGQIVGTVSASGNLIKQMAVSKSMQGENLAATLITNIIERLNANNIFAYRVFTKPEYKDLFISLGFNPSVEGQKFVALEGGDSSINGAISQLAKKITMEMGYIEQDTAAIVINGNPFTEGHLALCEYALKRHKRLIVFIVEEDGQTFSFKERFALAYLALRQYKNAIVLPATSYIVSKETFPSYFLKSVDEMSVQFALYDTLIFKNYFMPALGIKKRYFGSEVTDYMTLYNNIARETFGDGAEFIQRFTKDEEVISAKRIRGLIEEGEFDKAISLVPQATRSMFSLMLMQKGFKKQS